MEWGNFDFIINIEYDVHNSRDFKPKEKVNSRCYPLPPVQSFNQRHICASGNNFTQRL